MDKMYISPLAFKGTDAQRIQAAVDQAVETDIRVVVIPPKPRAVYWELDQTIRLPGDVTVILDGAAIKSRQIMFWIMANIEKTLRIVTFIRSKIFC